VTKETSEIRAKALRMLRVAVESDSLVGVKIFKMKLLSNLITHSLRLAPSEVESDVYLLAKALVKSEYREQLVHHS
jgi:hypothetical protein